MTERARPLRATYNMLFRATILQMDGVARQHFARVVKSRKINNDEARQMPRIFSERSATDAIDAVYKEAD